MLQVGKDMKSTTMSASDTEKYPFLTEEELQECREDELSDKQIEKKNDRKRTKIDDVLNANIIDRNVPRFRFDMKSTVNIVLLGKTGYGKSATANLICGSKHAFKTSDGAASCTTTTQTYDTSYGDMRFRIVDTPGLFDTTRSMKEVKHEAAKCVDLCDEGVHVVLYVYSATTTRFSPEELASITETKQLFGRDIFNFAGIVLTHTDNAFKDGKTIRDYIETTVRQTKLETFIKEDIKYRIVGVNNTARTQYEREFFRKSVFDLMHRILHETGQRAYSNEDMAKAKRMNIEMEQKRQAEIKAKQDEQTHRFHQSCDSIEKTVQRKAEESFKDMSLQQLERDKSSGNLAAKERIKEEVKREHPDEYKLIGEDIVSGIVQKHIGQSANSAEGKKQAQIEAEEKRKTELDEMKAKVEKAIADAENDLSDVVWEEIKAFIRRSDAKRSEEPTDDDYDNVTEKVWKALKDATRNRKTKKDVRREVVNQVKIKKEEISKLAKEIRGGCFPCGRKVITRQRGPILIEELQLGDEVVTLHHGALKYESVIFFSHAEPDVVLPYVTLNVGNDHVLAISPEHMVHVGSEGNLKQASEVREGDVLFVLEDEELTPREVTSVSAEWRTGAYCPHTTGGSLVVDGVLASCYTSIIPPSVAHVLLFPIRVIYKVLPSSWFKAMIEYDKSLGMPTWLVKYRKYFLK